MIHTLPGFWGPPTSTVDWCEANYVFTPYVAELFNTVSSLAMVAVGAVGIALHRRVLERRFLWAFGLLCLVGVGSIAFHATLRFGLQMLDELPMVYLVTLIVYVLIEDRPARRFGPWLPSALVGYVILITLLASTTRGAVEFYVFQISFGGLELFSLGRVAWLQRRLRDPRARTCFRLGIGAYLVAIAVWFIDLKACDFVGHALPAHGLFNPQLHAVWHVLVSLGFYLLLLVIAADRMAKLGRCAPVVLWPLPRLQTAAAATLSAPAPSSETAP